MKVTVQRKILSVCSQAELGRRLGRRAQTVNGWFKNKVPGELVVRVARAIDWKVTPHELRPDLYPNPTDGIPPEHQTTAFSEGKLNHENQTRAHP